MDILPRYIKLFHAMFFARPVCQKVKLQSGIERIATVAPLSGFGFNTLLAVPSADPLATAPTLPGFNFNSTLAAQRLQLLCLGSILTTHQQLPQRLHLLCLASIVILLLQLPHRQLLHYIISFIHFDLMFCLLLSVSR